MLLIKRPYPLIIIIKTRESIKIDKLIKKIQLKADNGAFYSLLIGLIMELFIEHIKNYT